MSECPTCYEDYEDYEDIFTCSKCRNDICIHCYNRINENNRKCPFCRNLFTDESESENEINIFEHIESDNYTFLASMSCAYRFLLLMYLCSLCCHRSFRN